MCLDVPRLGVSFTAPCFENISLPQQRGLLWLGGLENRSLMETSPAKCPLVFADANQDDLFTLFKRILIRTRHGAHVRARTREEAEHSWKGRERPSLGSDVDGNPPAASTFFWDGLGKRGCSLPSVHARCVCTHAHTDTLSLSQCFCISLPPRSQKCNPMIAGRKEVKVGWVWLRGDDF